MAYDTEEDGEPSTYSRAICSVSSAEWLVAMNEQIESDARQYRRLTRRPKDIGVTSIESVMLSRNNSGRGFYERSDHNWRLSVRSACVTTRWQYLRDLPGE